MDIVAWKLLEKAKELTLRILVVNLSCAELALKVLYYDVASRPPNRLNCVHAEEWGPD